MVFRSVFWCGSSVTMSVLKATVSVLPAARAGAARHARATIGTAAARRRTTSRTTGDLFFMDSALLGCVVRLSPIVRPRPRRRQGFRSQRRPIRSHSMRAPAVLSNTASRHARNGADGDAEPRDEQEREPNAGAANDDHVGRPPGA